MDNIINTEEILYSVEFLKFLIICNIVYYQLHRYVSVYVKSI